MIADNCCRKSSNRRLAPVVATGETAGVGQNAKYSVRADVFRFVSELRHCSMRSALRICANSGHSPHPELGPTVAEESAADVA